MKKIAFIAHGPGTANALNPLIVSLKETVIVNCYPFHQSSAEIWGVPLVSEEHFKEIFNEDWDLIVSGTGSLHKTEKEAPIRAKEKGIPFLSVLDSWNNYEERFKNKPDYIVCIDEMVKKNIVELGFNNEQVFALGNPHFDRLKNYQNAAQDHSVPFDIVFYSTMHKDTEKALKDLLKFKNKVPGILRSIYVTPHPREDSRHIQDLCERYTLEYRNYTESYSLLQSTLVSIGFGSTIQYEAQIIGKPTIFYKNYEELSVTLSGIPNSKIDRKTIEFNATENTVKLIKKLLNPEDKLGKSTN